MEHYILSFKTILQEDSMTIEQFQEEWNLDIDSYTTIGDYILVVNKNVILSVPMHLADVVIRS